VSLTPQESKLKHGIPRVVASTCWTYSRKSGKKYASFVSTMVEYGSRSVPMHAMLTRTLKAVKIKSAGVVFCKKDAVSKAGVVEFGRHKGLKIPWTLVSVPVRVRPSASSFSITYSKSHSFCTPLLVSPGTLSAQSGTLFMNI
jgi:hypothetical protein